MTRVTALLAFASLALALPQAPKPVVAPTPTAPKVVGALPKDGLKSLPWSNFNDLASALGFDPAKATPGAGGQSCVKSANGGFCWGSGGTGSSFNLGHEGGAFNGAGWNPFGTAGTPGGLLVGSIGQPSDGAHKKNV